MQTSMRRPGRGGRPNAAGRRLLRALCIGAAAWLLAACAVFDDEPRYATQTIRTPPASAEGLRCLNQCDSNRLQCEHLQRGAVDQCETDRARAAQDCEREARAAEAYCLRNRSPSCDLSYRNTMSLCQNRIRPCRLDTSRCDSLDKQCFQRCGGTLSYRRVCTSNCG